MTEAENESHECDGGWADRDAARPCPVCRPWHFACGTCGASARACADIVGKCCKECPHIPPSLGKPVRKRPRWLH